MTSPLNARISVRVTADLDVRVAITPDDGCAHPVTLTLTPDEAAIAARWLVEAADESVHESRSRRRSGVVTSPTPDLLATLDTNKARCASWHISESGDRYRCQLLAVHHPQVPHRFAGMTWQ